MESETENPKTKYLITYNDIQSFFELTTNFNESLFNGYLRDSTKNMKEIDRIADSIAYLFVEIGKLNHHIDTYMELNNLSFYNKKIKNMNNYISKKSKEILKEVNK